MLQGCAASRAGRPVHSIMGAGRRHQRWRAPARTDSDGRLKTIIRVPGTGPAAAGRGGRASCALVAATGLAGLAPPWVGSAATGALLAGVVVLALVLRDKGRMPAETAARLAELQARIRPHFLFNSLNSAIALVREDPARAETLLEDLSELFRHALVAKADAATLAEEVQVARHYMDIEQVRFGERLRVEWSVDPAAAKA